jgi:hypothetical protein
MWQAEPSQSQVLQTVTAHGRSRHAPNRYTPGACHTMIVVSVEQRSAKKAALLCLFLPVITTVSVLVELVSLSLSQPTMSAIAPVSLAGAL